jgi:pimeloyl-ACP methyl ester carboxylesterase
MLAAYVRLPAPGRPLTVYIEGDGRAWLSRWRFSDDPTPTDPVALRLAAVDPTPNLVYLARPCQYTDDPACHSRYWLGGRFAEEVIAATDQAIEHLRRRIAAPAVHLVGFSGGGAVAALVAARRRDVASLRTVAGNLDHEQVTQRAGVSRLDGSLNPADYAVALAGIAQHHFVGADDRVVPRSAIERFAERVGDPRCVRVSVVEGTSHEGGWAERWPDLLSWTVACGGQEDAGHAP